VTENRRDTAEGLNRRTSCIHRIQLQMHPAGGQRIEATLGTPGQEAPQTEWA